MIRAYLICKDCSEVLKDFLDLNLSLRLNPNDYKNIAKLVPPTKISSGFISPLIL